MPYDEYLPNAHPAITHGQRPLDPRSGGRGPSTVPGGIDPMGLGSPGAQSMFTEDLRQSDPYYLDFGGPRQSWEAGNQQFNRSVYRKFGRALTPREILDRTNPLNSRAIRAPAPPRSAVAPTAQESIGRVLRIGYDAHTREEPGSRKRALEARGKGYWEHMIKKAEEGNRLQELQRARRLRLRATNHAQVAAKSTVSTPENIGDLPESYVPTDVSGRPVSSGMPPVALIAVILAVTTAIFFIPTVMKK